MDTIYSTLTIIDLCGEILLTGDMQIGYKTKHSTSVCTTVWKRHN